MKEADIQLICVDPDLMDAIKNVIMVERKGIELYDMSGDGDERIESTMVMLNNEPRATLFVSDTQNIRGMDIKFQKQAVVFYVGHKKNKTFLMQLAGKGSRYRVATTMHVFWDELKAHEAKPVMKQEDKLIWNRYRD